MACDFPYKKYKKRLFQLHIDVDSCNPADNRVLYMMSVPWLVLFVYGSLERVLVTASHEKNRINRKNEHFAMHL